MTRLSADEAVFKDHFPGFPVVPGVLLTEMMGQAAAQCLLAERLPRGRPMLVQIKSARFRDWVRPDQSVVLTAEIRSSRPEFATANCRAQVEGRQVASAELLFAFLAPDHPASQVKDVVLERYLAALAQAQPDAGSAAV